MPEKLSSLLKQHNEILRQIMFNHRSGPQDQDALLGDYKVDYMEEKRILSLLIPETPPTLKMFSRRLRGCGFDGIHEYYSNRWYNLIRQAKEELLLKYKSEIKPYMDAIIFTKFLEDSSVLRDCDNYALYILHNALVKNNLIEEDNFEQMRYSYQVSGSVNQKFSTTSITIIENDGAWRSSKNCTECVINNKISLK